MHDRERSRSSGLTAVALSGVAATLLCPGGVFAVVGLPGAQEPDGATLRLPDARVAVPADHGRAIESAAGTLAGGGPAAGSDVITPAPAPASAAPRPQARQYRRVHRASDGAPSGARRR
ncbi:MAG: hypothetical protein U0S48_02040 [Solirubrobacteraceae bacterium]